MVVPVRLTTKEQYAAYTIRPKLMKLLEHYIRPFKPHKVNESRAIDVYSDLVTVDVKAVIRKLKLPRVEPSPLYRGGEQRARSALETFIDRKLESYVENRNHPDRYGTSDMSPYLRFGCISPVAVLREVIESGGRKEEILAFVEEAFVRRELAENFTFYNANYRSLACLPDWARRTLGDHRADPREALFRLEELEAGTTGDELWDASQHEMVKTGKMAGYLRMYWGKRVIGWTQTPEDALRYLLYLNDKYEIDGRSPNGYAGILWCFGKHDRAFAERPVYGKIRYMSPAAQKKKFDVDAYIKKAGFKEQMPAYPG
jgi:deoxyribodipyrimidine photo-lyase